MKIAVVGAGIMGLAAAWALARAGHEVAVFDQGAVPNPLGASVDEHRLVFHAYGAASGYARMVDDALAAWDQLWTELGERLYVPTGLLALASDGDDWVRRSAETLAAQGRPVRWFERADIERALPMIDPAGVEAAFFLPVGGTLLADRIVAALAAHLVGRGVAVEAGGRVVDVDAARVRLTLAGGAAIDSDALIVAAGAWVGRLVPAVARRAVPSRQTRLHVAPPAGLAARWAIAPAIMERRRETGFDLAPPVGGTRIALSDHRLSRIGDPDDDRAGGGAETEPLVAAAARRIRDFARYRVIERRACYAAAERDEQFVVERLAPQAWVVSACSGHGFKFAPLIGLRLAAALLDDRRAGDISLWAAGKAA